MTTLNLGTQQSFQLTLKLQNKALLLKKASKIFVVSPLSILQTTFEWERFAATFRFTKPHYPLSHV